MTVYHIVVAGSVAIAALSQMMLKKASTIKWSSPLREYLNPWVIGGYMIMLLSLMTDVWAISKGVQVKEVSTLESLSYLLVPLFSFVFFKEKITFRKCCAIAIILLGVVVFFNDFL